MNVIGKTRSGYLIEIEPDELDDITGCGGRYDNRVLSTGTIFTVCKSFRHLSAIKANEEERKKIAEQLRSMATLIEMIPDAYQSPEIPIEKKEEE